MSGISALVLTPAAHGLWTGLCGRLRKDRGLGAMGAGLQAAALVLAWVFLRLEGPAWQAAARRYGPWFAHLRGRPSRPGDPLRYALQTAWLLFFIPPLHQRDSRLRAHWERWRAGAARRRERAIGRLDGLPDAVRGSAWLGAVRRRVSGLGAVSRRLLFGAASALACALAVLVVTQPFNDFAQLVFVTLLFGLAVTVRRVPGRFSLLILIILSVTISSRYIWWRYSATLNWTSTLDLTLGLLLLAAETYSWVVLLLGYVQVAWPLRRPPAPLPPRPGDWPTVDLFIPTYNEDLDVVKPTVYAALGMDWPADKLRIHLLDDGRRDAFRAFAEEVGIHYVTRPDNRHAKAGNLNHAMAGTDGELIAIFDCDHIPTRSFLQVTVGHFLRDPRLALVQTPHHFFSPDPFERNLGHFGTQPNENTLFYGLVQDGNDLWNAAFFCGSCGVVRRSALESVGGFAVETVTEDAHTALRLHRAGYNSAYLRIPQAAGLATESLSAHIGQRIRWARGMVQIFRLDNPLFGKGLGFFQRVCYLNAMLHFLSGIPRIVYLTAPLAFLLLHSYIVYAPAFAILLNVAPHLLHANLTNSVLQGSYRRTLWGEIYETVLAWYIARPTTVALLAPHKGAFNVTAKGGLVEKQYYDWTISHPYMLLALANLAGLLFGVWRLFTGPADEVLTVLITMAWVCFNLAILGGAVAVAAELRQIRRNPRVPSELPARLRLESGHVLTAILSDYSEGGAGITLSGDHIVRPDSKVHLCLSRGGREFAFPGRVTRHLGSRLSIRFDPMSRRQHINFIQCTFARADAWLGWQRRIRGDQPIQSLRGIVELGLNGYYQLARHAPFPFSAIFRGGVAAADWLLSFVPVRHPNPSSDLIGSHT